MATRKETRMVGEIEIVRHLNKAQSYQEACKIGYNYAVEIDGQVYASEDCSIYLLLKDRTEIYILDCDPLEGKMPKPVEIDSMIMGNACGYEFYGKNVHIFVSEDDCVRMDFNPEPYDGEREIKFSELPLYA